MLPQIPDDASHFGSALREESTLHLHIPLEFVHLHGHCTVRCLCKAHATLQAILPQVDFQSIACMKVLHLNANLGQHGLHLVMRKGVPDGWGVDDR